MAIYTDENFLMWKESEMKNPQQLSLQIVRESSKKASLRKLVIFSIATSRSKQQYHKLLKFIEYDEQTKIIETNNKELFDSKSKKKKEAKKIKLANQIEMHVKLATSIIKHCPSIPNSSIVDQISKIEKIIAMGRAYFREYSANSQVCNKLYKTNPEFNEFCKILMKNGTKDQCDKSTQELVPLILGTFQQTKSVLLSVDCLIQHMDRL